MINANKERLSAFLHGQVQYVVPFYQRTYVWEEENWETLWEGIKSVFTETQSNNKNEAEHFIGTLIIKQRAAEQVGENKYDIIDGQQRLTTIAILLKAMTKSRKGELVNLQKILGGNLFFEDSHGNRHLRIIHSRIDAEYFEAIMNDKGVEHLNNQDHRMIKAFNFFQHKTSGMTDKEVDTIMNVILSRVPVVNMLLSKEDDEQVIFDTINSLGVKLSTAELLKNFVFKEQELQDLYESHWAPIFEANEEQIDFWSKDKTTGRIIRSNIEVLLYCYLIIKTQSEIRLETLFKEYKQWLKDKTTDDRKVFLLDLKKYAECYLNFPVDEDISEISFRESEKRFFHVIENLEITTILPLVLYIFKNVDSEQERIYMFHVLESYIVRRNVCRLTTKNYNNLFIDVIRKLKQESENNKRPVSHKNLMDILTSFGEETNVFPDNRTFKDGFKNSVLSNKHAREILYCIALKQKDTPHTDVQKLTINNLTVEHILPKKWEQHWKKNEINEQETLERNKKLKTLGNLTLVKGKLNSKMQNASWANKKDILRKHSSLEMTINYLEKPEWDESEIDSRAVDLSKAAEEIWSPK